MDNITNQEFAGFAGVKKTPKSGEWIKVSNNYYTFDNLKLLNKKQSIAFKSILVVFYI
ncbi:hypothetical protein [Clostridium botulinum]|nr:hypothetical protein [Clostridium botulinum]